MHSTQENKVEQLLSIEDLSVESTTSVSAFIKVKHWRWLAKVVQASRSLRTLFCAYCPTRWHVIPAVRLSIKARTCLLLRQSICVKYAATALR